MNDEGADIQLKLAADPRENHLVVNGTDITKNVRRVIVETDGRVTRVGLELNPPELELTGPGVVEVIRPGSPDVGPLLELLDGIDPAQLEQDALSGLGMGGDATTAILEVIKGYVRGRA